MKIFAERLKDLRLEKGLSIRQLAKKVDLSPMAISHWENYSRTPSADALIILSKFFGVTTDYLLGLED